MNDPTNPTTPPEPSAPGPAGPDPIPLEPDEPWAHDARARDLPVARPARASLLNDGPEPCPNCGAPMDATHVVCVRCGFDQKAGVLRHPEVGVADVEAPTEKPEFVKPGRLPAAAFVAVGAALAVASMVATGVNSSTRGTGVMIAGVVLTLYETLLHTGTGLAAVAVAARVAEERFSRIDLAAARMFVAFSAFQLLRHLAIPGIPPWLGATTLLLLGGGAYILCLMALFKRDLTGTSMIGLSHLSLWGAVQLANELAVWLNNSQPTGTPGAA